MSIGENIKRLRKEKNITQIELARVIKRSMSMVQKYECDAVPPPVHIIHKLADFLGTTPAFLLNGEIFKLKDGARIDKHNYYLNIAEAVLRRGTCLRRNYGAVIVNNDEIVSSGYSGSPRGDENCCDRGFCQRVENNIPHGERYELCNSVHAEMNAIIQAARKDMLGATLYLVGIEANGSYVENTAPCSICARLIKNAGIEKVIVRVNKENFKEL